MNNLIKNQSYPVKMSIIPPSFHEDKFVTNFKEKTELFNAFFALRDYLTDNCLSSVSFCQESIVIKIIHNSKLKSK